MSGTYSNTVTVLAASVPTKPLNLANNVAITASGVIGFSWTAGSYDGGSPIIDYRIRYRNGTNAYSILASNVDTTAYV